MDEKDRDILCILQTNARISNQELSEQVNLSPSPCLRRVRILEQSGVIRGYTAIVDEEAFGLPVIAFVRVRITVHGQESIAAFEEAVLDMDAVLDCYVMTGSADYLLRVVVESLKDYEDFIRTQLHRVPWVASIDTSFAYGQVKRSTVFPRPRT
jgi:Lrp/AsnC family transcriptional regulator, leucine-responsive regulatory protein